MHAVDILANSIPLDDREALPVDPIREICCLTGELTECIPRGELFGQSFTNMDVFARPDSNYVGLNTFFSLKYKWQRCSNWFCDGKTFERLDRKGVRRKVLQEEMPENWIGYSTTSYKKHGVLRAPINTKSRIWIHETLSVNLTDYKKMIEWWTVLNDALVAGISRPMMETLECNAFITKTVGIDRWLKFLEWAKPKYKSPMYVFLVYLLPSQAELQGKEEKEPVVEEGEE